MEENLFYQLYTIKVNQNSEEIYNLCENLFDYLTPEIENSKKIGYKNELEERIRDCDNGFEIIILLGQLVEQCNNDGNEYDVERS